MASPPLPPTQLLLLSCAATFLIAAAVDLRLLSHSSGADIDAATLSLLDYRDHSRLLYLSTLTAKKKEKTSVPIASGKILSEPATYVASVAFGTPPQHFLVAVDTSNDAAWVPCAGCVGCPSSVEFSPARSTTFRNLSGGSGGGGFNLSYAGSTVQAALVQDTLTLAGDSIPGYTFGCLRHVASSSPPPPQGLLGLGRGALSLTSQTRKLYSSTFSYCLPTFRSLNFSGDLRLGISGNLLNLTKNKEKKKTTALLTNPHRPSLYYVNLTGVLVGGRAVAAPASSLAFDPVNGAGTVVDSGTSFTRLVAPLYSAVRDAFRRRAAAAAQNVTSLGGFDTCLQGHVAVPGVAFEFEEGLRVTLPEENVVIRSTFGNLTCLAMAAAPEDGGVDSVVNVIANYQQQNHRLLFDVPNGRFAITRQLCTA